MNTVTEITASESERRAAWLADRRTCITATDVAAILGLSRWSSPIQIYMDKKGLLEGGENESMRWGRRLERPILEAYSDVKQIPIAFADPYQLLRCPTLSLLGATLDARWLEGDTRPVDAKNVRQFDGALWGEAGSDEFPIYYQLQLMVQMMVTGAPFADLAVLFSGSTFVPYTIAFDPETAEIITEKVSVWWEQHIVQDNPPDPDGSVGCTEYLKKRFARAGEITKEPTPELMEWIAEREQARLKLEAAEAMKARFENLIKTYLGEANAVPGVLTWKNNKGSKVTDYEHAYLELISQIEQNNPLRIRDLAQNILDKFTITKPGARVLRISKQEPLNG